ncbi:MAG: hypothetical protein K9N40_04420 [Candidatus Cloacimonetes bacterium]|nr:hypothetical protein [Candidatus Cloacimonadota bacterium]
MDSKEVQTGKKELPWYTVTMLLTVLGAISIFMLFGVYFYKEHGIVFWSIIVSWITILLGATLEIGRQERLRRDLNKQKNKEIAELKQQIEELQTK